MRWRSTSSGTSKIPCWRPCRRSCRGRYVFRGLISPAEAPKQWLIFLDWEKVISLINMLVKQGRLIHHVKISQSYYAMSRFPQVLLLHRVRVWKWRTWRAAATLSRGETPGWSPPSSGRRRGIPARPSSAAPSDSWAARPNRLSESFPCNNLNHADMK